jgi:glycerol-3-phosphate dehydrogenase
MSADYDLVVVGAGIHGAGVAQAAAAAGYRTLVLEQTRAAVGTSSRSSKLIHGGLRYLEHGELRLVRECLQERQLLLRLAPELVKLKPFYIPIYHDTRRRPWQLRTGLSLYALLGGLGEQLRFQTLARSDWDGLNGLRTQGLQAVFQYWDGQTDDAALTRAVLHSACSLGAELRMPAYLTGAQLQPEGVDVTFTDDGRQQHCRCTALVICAGPWIEQVESLVTPAYPRPHVDLVQGTHVLLAAPAAAGIYYLEVPEDGRGVFVMPWQGQTLVGTTETPFTGSAPATVAPLATERAYLRAAVSHYFPQLLWEERASFAGLRVLPRSNERPFDRGRELILSQDRRENPRVVGVYGGKLTSYRADAAKVVARIRASLPARAARADTRHLPLSPVD